MERLQFPQNFLFGTATAAVEIEGGYLDDGKGLNIWDVFTSKKGKIADGSNTYIACDTYKNFQTDIDIMADLKLDAYRYSIAWSRVIPEGTGKVNEAGLDYYARLTDALLEKGIRPFVTLYHWDMPQALFKKNKGFVSKDTASYFADYAGIVCERLGDRIKDWITLNEPWEHAMFGHLLGDFAPGIRNPWAYTRVAHHQLLGHGLATQKMRSLRSDLKIGATLSQFPIYSVHYDPSVKDMKSNDTADLLLNRFFLDGIIKGKYPDKLMKILKPVMPKVTDQDMKTIGQKIDFLGVNYYSRLFTERKWYVPRLKTWIASGPRDERHFDSELGSHAYPEGMKELARRYREDYGNLPVYITENGTGGTGIEGAVKGSIQDQYRIKYVSRYLECLKEAIDEGSDIRGYFYWTFMDNFTWTQGYSHPMGIVKVDFKSQKRTVRDSGYWFKDLIEKQESRKNNGI